MHKNLWLNAKIINTICGFMITALIWSARSKQEIETIDGGLQKARCVYTILTELSDENQYPLDWPLDLKVNKKGCKSKIG